MAGIFFFSSLPDPLGGVPRKDIVSLTGHFLEYAGLAFLLYRALERSHIGGGDSAMSGFNQATGIAGLAISFIYAVLDEWHQSFVPGRDASPLDVGFDVLGAIVALSSIRHSSLLRKGVGKFFKRGGDGIR